MTFGEKVAYLRNKKGLTIRQLAIEAGVSQNVILQYEKDEYRPKLPVMYEVLSEIFGCSEEALMDDSVDIITQDTESSDTTESDDTESSDMEPDDMTDYSDPTINNKETTMTFGEKLSFLRNLKGLSTSQVADAVGVSRNAIGNYESGLRRPRNVGIYRALANLLGCTVEELKDDSVSFMPDDPHEIKAENAVDKKAAENKASDNKAPEEKSAPAKTKAPKAPAKSDKKAKVPITKTDSAADKKSDTEKADTENQAKAITESAPEKSSTKPEKAVSVDKTPDISEPFGKKLSALRNEKNLTLAEVAERAGINLNSYKHMEYRNGRPRTIEEYEKLAKVLGCDVEYLTAGDKKVAVSEKADAPAVESPAVKADVSEKKAVSEAPVKKDDKKDAEKSTKAPADKTAPAETNSAPINIEETPSDAPLGKKLSALRKEKNLTLAQMAEKLGINVDAYKTMEYRNGRPREPKIYNKLARILGCPVVYLREGDKRFEKAAPVSAPIEKTEKPAPIKETATVENKAIEAPITDAAPIEKQTASASSKSSELIKLVSRLSVLLSSDEISKDEKDAVMVALNGAYWGR